MALKEMIEKPAAQAGLTLEMGLADRMIADMRHSPGRLALLSFTLAQLFEMQQDAKLTSQAYADLGGIHGAIKQQAEQVYQILNEQAGQALPVLFRELVTVDVEG